MDKETPDQTPLPGSKVDEPEGRASYERMQSLYMEPFSRNGTPSRCAFPNIEPSSWSQFRDRAWVADDTRVIFIEEAGRVRSWPQEVHVATMGQVRAYYEVREPWEFADVYPAAGLRVVLRGHARRRVLLCPASRPIAQ